jgi:homocysteine S-methyltransferase
MSESVALATAARDEFWADPSNRANRLRPVVAASVGPYGAMLGDGAEYRGCYNLSDAALMEFHRPRLTVLVESGADLLACETIPCLSEAVALARLLQEFPDTSAWMSFSCRDDVHNCEGQKISDCVSILNDYPQIAAVGVNCTRPQHITALLQQMRDHTDKPLLVYPNSGEYYDGDSKRWLGPADTKTLALHAGDWYTAGARLIGGCCRTTPKDIRAIRERLDEFRFADRANLDVI